MFLCTLTLNHTVRPHPTLWITTGTPECRKETHWFSREGAPAQPPVPDHSHSHAPLVQGLALPIGNGRLCFDPHGDEVSLISMRRPLSMPSNPQTKQDRLKAKEAGQLFTEKLCLQASGS